MVPSPQPPSPPDHLSPQSGYSNGFPHRHTYLRGTRRRRPRRVACTLGVTRDYRAQPPTTEACPRVGAAVICFCYVRVWWTRTPDPGTVWYAHLPTGRGASNIFFPTNLYLPVFTP